MIKTNFQLKKQQQQINDYSLCNKSKGKASFKHSLRHLNFYIKRSARTSEFSMQRHFIYATIRQIKS